MKFTCEKSLLQEAVSVTSKAVSGKSVLPVLEGILIKCEEDRLLLCGTDLEIGIEYTVEANVIEKGSAVFSSRMFGEIIRNLPDGIIEVSCDDESYNTKISCGYTKFEIKGINGDEFPEIKKISRENSVKIKENVLKDMIRQTVFSIGNNENRYILTGSLFEIENDNLIIVSVDGYRLALRKEKIENTNNCDSFVIPGKTLLNLLKLFSDEEGDLTIFYDDKNVLFETENYIVSSRLLEGEFLNYSQIIPKSKDITVKTKVRPLINSIERAGLIINASETGKSPVIISLSDDRIHISCSSSAGKSEDYINADIKGEELTIGFNYKYLCDALKACDDEEIKIEFTNSLSPCTILPTEGDKFLYIVLPVRLKGE